MTNFSWNDEKTYIFVQALGVLSFAQVPTSLTELCGVAKRFQDRRVNTIIMSLWEVGDAATEVLMTKFYTLLTKGKSKREAFDRAVEAVKKEYPSPEYWAAFIMLD